MAHDPSLGFADYFSAADATAASVATLMPAMDEGAPELFGLQAGMELLGMRGLATMHGTATASAAASQSKAFLVDAGAGDGGATMRFLSEQHHLHHHHQAPLSLSLCRPESVLHQHLGGSPRQPPPAAAWVHDASVPVAHGHAAWHLRSSRFLLPAQQLLQEFCSLPVDSTAKRTKPPPQEEGVGGSSSASPQIQAMDALELQRLKDKLYVMLEEVDRRYRRYCEQMRGVAAGLEAAAGQRAAAAYTAVAARTISRHFRNLRDGIVGQLQGVRKALGEKADAAGGGGGVPGMTKGETPRLRVLDQSIRHHKALHQAAGMMDSHPWRPQRGLPDRAVTILRAWLFEHFLHPYPSDVDKHILARQTGLSRSQVSNWFINARVRLWKPMVEEMYVEEMKDQDGSTSAAGHQDGDGGLNPNPSSVVSDGGQMGDASGAGGLDGDGGRDQKPTRAQLLHDAGSLASVVNIGGVAARAGAGSRVEGFGIMDHLDFDAYDDDSAQGGFGAGAGGGVSLTLGLQQHDAHLDGGVNIAFGAPSTSAHGGGGGGGGFLFPAGGEQMDGVGHSGHGHHVVQFAASMDGGDADHYRGLNAGFHLLRDLAG